MNKMYIYANGPECRNFRFTKIFLWKKIVLEGLDVYVGPEKPFFPSWDGIRFGILSGIVSWLISWLYFRLNRPRKYPRHQVEIKAISEWQTQIRFLLEDKKRTLLPLDLQYSVVYLRGEGKKYLVRFWSDAKAEEATWEKELNAFQTWLTKEASARINAESKKRSAHPSSIGSFGLVCDEIIHQKVSELLGIPAEMLKYPTGY